jgi:RNA polymerase sigma-70 factor (ECF subfamily)
MLAASLPDDEAGAFSIDIPHLIQQAQRGDREAVATLYRVHVRMIYRYMASRVYSDKDAEDLTAEVFVRMVEALPNYQITGAPFEAWLYRIASSRISDFYRSKANRQSEELPENLTGDEGSYEETMTEAQDVDSLRRALRQLPDEHQTILILRFVERKSHEEVALLLGRSVTAVKSAQHRALSKLTELLGGDRKVRHYIRGQHE